MKNGVIITIIIRIIFKIIITVKVIIIITKIIVIIITIIIIAINILIIIIIIMIMVRVIVIIVTIMIIITPVTITIITNRHSGCKRALQALSPQFSKSWIKPKRQTLHQGPLAYSTPNWKLENTETQPITV